MTQYPPDHPVQASSAGGEGGAGQPGTGLSNQGPYAGAPGTPMPGTPMPGTPMPQYDVGAAAGPRDHSGAVVAFILGIFSVAGFAVAGPVAWVLASKALKEMDRPNGPVYTNRGLAVAAKVLGIIGTVFLGLAIIALLVVVVFAVTTARRDGA